MERAFDRLASIDPRNDDFPMRSIMPILPARTRHWRYIQLDQGMEGACTGFAVTMEAAANPVPVFGDPIRQTNVDLINGIARAIYHRAQQLDEYPGEAYEGSSVLGAMKAGVEQGWYGEYRWATGTAEMMADDCITAIGYHGPVIFGANWRSGMDQRNDQGVITFTGPVRGGHAFVGTAYDKRRDAVFIPNSWGGEGWGWLPRRELAAMLGDGGEAAIAVGRKRPRVART